MMTMVNLTKCRNGQTSTLTAKGNITLDLNLWYGTIKLPTSETNMTEVELAVFRINQKLLVEQRTWLLEQSMKGIPEADGLMNMIDTILDAAWDSGVLPELDDDDDGDDV
jgi:hypothetical protein